MAPLRLITEHFRAAMVVTRTAAILVPPQGVRVTFMVEPEVRLLLVVAEEAPAVVGLWQEGQIAVLVFLAVQVAEVGMVVEQDLPVEVAGDPVMLSVV